MEKGKKYPRAVVREEGRLFILDDPDASTLISAVSKCNCKNLFDLNIERIAHFKNRVKELDRSAADTVIVVINVDDVNGGPIADMLMPGFNWQEIRDRGEMPVARGLASRDGIQEILSQFDVEASEKLNGMSEIAVVVVDNQVAEIFSA